MLYTLHNVGLFTLLLSKRLSGDIAGMNAPGCRLDDNRWALLLLLLLLTAHPGMCSHFLEALQPQ
jgi:hypothetical protein